MNDKYICYIYDIYITGKYQLSDFSKEMDIPRTPVCMKLLKLSYKLSQLGKCGEEMTGSTNAGTKSEDTSLLFRQKKDRGILTGKSLKRIVSRIQEAQEGVSMDMTEVLDLPDEIEESNTMDELRESVRKRGLNPVQVLKLGAILCDVESGPIWIRVKNATLYLTGSQTDLEINQWKALLWVLIGISGSQVVEEENLTFEAMRKNICTHYRRAVHEGIPSLEKDSPLIRS